MLPTQLWASIKSKWSPIILCLSFYPLIGLSSLLLYISDRFSCTHKDLTWQYQQCYFTIALTSGSSPHGLCIICKFHFLLSSSSAHMNNTLIKIMHNLTKVWILHEKQGLGPVLCSMQPLRYIVCLAVSRNNCTRGCDCLPTQTCVIFHRYWRGSAQ